MARQKKHRVFYSATDEKNAKCFRVTSNEVKEKDKFVLFTCPYCGCQMVIIVGDGSYDYKCEELFNWNPVYTAQHNKGKKHCQRELEIKPMTPLDKLAQRLNNESV